jgi:hypothetical protein
MKGGKKDWGGLMVGLVDGKETMNKVHVSATAELAKASEMADDRRNLRIVGFILIL